MGVDCYLCLWDTSNWWVLMLLSLLYHVIIRTEPCHSSSRSSRTLLCFPSFAKAFWLTLWELRGCTNFLYSQMCSALCVPEEAWNWQSVADDLNLFWPTWLMCHLVLLLTWLMCDLLPSTILIGQLIGKLECQFIRLAFQTVVPPGNGLGMRLVCCQLV